MLDDEIDIGSDDLIVEEISSSPPSDFSDFDFDEIEYHVPSKSDLPLRQQGVPTFCTLLDGCDDDQAFDCGCQLKALGVVGSGLLGAVVHVSRDDDGCVKLGFGANGEHVLSDFGLLWLKRGESVERIRSFPLGCRISWSEPSDPMRTRSLFFSRCDLPDCWYKKYRMINGYIHLLNNMFDASRCISDLTECGVSFDTVVSIAQHGRTVPSDDSYLNVRIDPSKNNGSGRPPAAKPIIVKMSDEVAVLPYSDKHFSSPLSCEELRKRVIEVCPQVRRANIEEGKKFMRKSYAFTASLFKTLARWTKGRTHIFDNSVVMKESPQVHLEKIEFPKSLQTSVRHGDCLVIGSAGSRLSIGVFVGVRDTKPCVRDLCVVDRGCFEDALIFIDQILSTMVCFNSMQFPPPIPYHSIPISQLRKKGVRDPFNVLRNVLIWKEAAERSGFFPKRDVASVFNDSKVKIENHVVVLGDVYVGGSLSVSLTMKTAAAIVFNLYGVYGSVLLVRKPGWWNPVVSVRAGKKEKGKRKKRSGRKRRGDKRKSEIKNRSGGNDTTPVFVSPSQCGKSLSVHVRSGMRVSRVDGRPHVFDALSPDETPKYIDLNPVLVDGKVHHLFQ